MAARPLPSASLLIFNLKVAPPFSLGPLAGCFPLLPNSVARENLSQQRFSCCTWPSLFMKEELHDLILGFPLATRIRFCQQIQQPLDGSQLSVPFFATPRTTAPRRAHSLPPTKSQPLNSQHRPTALYTVLLRHTKTSNLPGRHSSIAAAPSISACFQLPLAVPSP